jgi:DNA-directed RNA polymerase specialized sigma24 family protein
VDEETVLGTQFPEVLAAARTGAEWAWISIYRDLSPVVLGYLRARRATEPEDLLGEVFLQVARDLPAFDGSERDFRAWAFVRSRRPTTEPYEHRLAPTRTRTTALTTSARTAEAADRLRAPSTRGFSFSRNCR